MKNKTMMLSLLALMVFALAPLAADAQKHYDDDGAYSERDQIDQTYTLAAGARVEVRGINGTVDIETAAGSTAEVHVTRLARNRDDLEYHKIYVEQTAGGLVVRGEEKNRDHGDHQVRHRVTLRLPRQIDLKVSGVNGRATVGAVDGPINLSGINGAVEVGQAVGYADISGINGRVKVNIVRLGERGIHVSGVNGGVEIQFAEDLNADVEVTGINGRVNADVPNVTVMGKLERNNFRAKIGAGGTPITISGVNGHVKLTRGGVAG